MAKHDSVYSSFAFCVQRSAFSVFCLLLLLGEFKCNRICYYECLLYMFDLLRNFFYLLSTVTFAFSVHSRFGTQCHPTFAISSFSPRAPFSTQFQICSTRIFHQSQLLSLFIVFVRNDSLLAALWVVSRAFLMHYIRHTSVQAFHKNLFHLLLHSFLFLLCVCV